MNKRSTITISILLGLVLVVSLAYLLAWVANGFHGGVEGWQAYFYFGIIAAGLLLGGWFLLRLKEPLPTWLLALAVFAALIRLGAGVVWYVALPRYGYDSPSEQAGYVMADAQKRDQAAWNLAKSRLPLTAAYQSAPGRQFRKADQYGGLLVTSAGLYRYLAQDSHPPLGMVMVTAAFSALAVLLVFAFAQRAWTVSAATLAAWFLAFYPETVLQGSTQMREAFLIPLVTAAFYGLLLYRARHSGAGLAWITGSLLLTLFFSPPTAGLLLVCLLIATLIWGGIIQRTETARNKTFHKPLFWVAIVVLMILILAGSYLALERLAPRQFGSPVEMLGWWVQRSASFQAHLTERSSGWVQKIFDTTPDWLHTPLLLVYGTLQPFLPAAMIDITGVWTWRAIGIWRAIGWAILLPMLLYAPLRAWSKKHGEAIARGLSVVVWAVILIAAFRAGADQWDNVRYRTAFIGLQIPLAAWAWTSFRTAPDPWLKRAVILVISMLFWYTAWYSRRYVYFDWPVTDPIKTFGLGLLTAALIILWDYFRTSNKSFRSSKRAGKTP